MRSLSDTVVCFDLDDTLYKEIDFVKSAYGEVALLAGGPKATEQMLDWYYAGDNAFEMLITTYGLSISVSDCLKIYRNHFPDISLDDSVLELLKEIKEDDAKLGLISDGRSVTQRNKMKALGLEGLFDVVIISEEFGSEKPCLKNFQVVMDKYPQRYKYIYIGDNTKKDFFAPNQLGWISYCLADDGRNIHRQDMSLDKEYMPQYVIKNIEEIKKRLYGR